MFVKIDISRFEIEKLLRQYIEDRLSVDLEDSKSYVIVKPTEDGTGSFSVSFYLNSGE